MEELQPEELEGLVQELKEESEEEEALSPEVEALLRDLQPARRFTVRLRAARQLGGLSSSSRQIVQALGTVAEIDHSDEVRAVAAESLRAPVHQEYLRQHPGLMKATERALRQLPGAQASLMRAQEAAQYLERAFALEDESEYEEALEECDAALRLDPTLADAHNLRGVILEELGRNGEAIQSYREALRLDPVHAAAHENLRAAEAELDEYRISPGFRKLRCKRSMGFPPCPDSASFRCADCGDALCRTHAMLFSPPDAGSEQDENSGVYCPFHYQVVVDRVNLQAVEAELQVLFEAKDQTSHYTWQLAGVDLDREAGNLTIHGYPYGEPAITVPVGQIASCEIVEREDIQRNLTRTLEGCGGGDWGDLLLIPLAYVFLEIFDRVLAKSTKVPVLKLTQSPSDDSSQRWVIHLRSKTRGNRGQVETLEIAGHVVAFLRQTGYGGAMPRELGGPVEGPAVLAGEPRLPPDLEASPEQEAAGPAEEAAQHLERAEEPSVPTEIEASQRRKWIVVGILASFFSYVAGVLVAGYLVQPWNLSVSEYLDRVFDMYLGLSSCCGLPGLALSLFVLGVATFRSKEPRRSAIIVMIIAFAILNLAIGCGVGMFNMLDLSRY